MRKSLLAILAVPRWYSVLRRLPLILKTIWKPQRQFKSDRKSG